MCSATSIALNLIQGPPEEYDDGKLIAVSTSRPDILSCNRPRQSVTPLLKTAAGRPEKPVHFSMISVFLTHLDIQKHPMGLRPALSSRDREQNITMLMRKLIPALIWRTKQNTVVLIPPPHQSCRSKEWYTRFMTSLDGIPEHWQKFDLIFRLHGQGHT